MSWTKMIRGLEALGIHHNDDLLEHFDCLMSELMKWNKTYNLTAIRDPEQAMVLHLFDSLSIYPFVKGPRLLDVGTGAGFPGIPMAILYSDIEVTLLDSNGKKTRFLQHMKTRLGLNNCRIVHGRVEDQKGQYEQICCRAFASLADITRLTAHLLAPNGEILAMKGQLDSELAVKDGVESHIESGAGDDYQVQAHTLQVPELDAERHLVVLKRVQADTVEP